MKILNDEKYIYFGKYPQSIVDDKELIKKLDMMTITNSLGYTEYKGNEYKKEIANPCESDYTFSNGETIVKGKTYYFKVEPIKWIILETKENEYKLLSECILDALEFDISYFDREINGNIVYPNSYQYSIIRAWLNDYNVKNYNRVDYVGTGFITLAFSNEERKLIKNHKLAISDNIEIEDKIYLLSFDDITNSSYGFSNNPETLDMERRAIITDYSLSKHCWMNNEIDSDYYKKGFWWLRSPYEDSFKIFVKAIDINGYVTFMDVRNERLNGVRIAVDIKKDI